MPKNKYVPLCINDWHWLPDKSDCDAATVENPRHILGQWQFRDRSGFACWNLKNTATGLRQVKQCKHDRRMLVIDLELLDTILLKTILLETILLDTTRCWSGPCPTYIKNLPALRLDLFQECVLLATPPGVCGLSEYFW